MCIVWGCFGRRRCSNSHSILVMVDRILRRIMMHRRVKIVLVAKRLTLVLALAQASHVVHRSCARWNHLKLAVTSFGARLSLSFSIVGSRALLNITRFQTAGCLSRSPNLGTRTKIWTELCSSALQIKLNNALILLLSTSKLLSPIPLLLVTGCYNLSLPGWLLNGLSQMAGLEQTVHVAGLLPFLCSHDLLVWSANIIVNNVSSFSIGQRSGHLLSFLLLLEA